MFSINFIIDNRYIIYNNIIGEGISKIYEGKDIKFNKKVAIKQIFYNKSNLKFIEQEINILKRTNHVNIIKLYNYYYYSEYAYLVFEFCEEGDLYNYKFNRSEENIKKFYMQLVKGLIYLKNMNIYHHDIKPHNILIKDKILKIADFGFANNFNMICGSPLYMAPELFNFNKFSRKSDIWSVGIILYELLNNILPYNFKKCQTIKDIVKSFTNELLFTKNISLEAQDLLQKILKVNFKERIDWDEMLIHPWIEDVLSEDVLSEDVVSEDVVSKEHSNIETKNNNILAPSKEIDATKNSFSIDGYILNSPIYNNYFNKCIKPHSSVPIPIFKSSSIKNKKNKGKFKYTFLTSI